MTSKNWECLKCGDRIISDRQETRGHGDCDGVLVEREDAARLHEYYKEQEQYKPDDRELADYARSLFMRQETIPCGFHREVKKAREWDEWMWLWIMVIVLGLVIAWDVYLFRGL